MTTRRPPSQPDIRCYPDVDREFHGDVVDAITHSRETLSQGERLIERVRTELRSRYPAVVIHERDPLAEVGEHRDHWYVFRDGKIA